MNIEKASGRGIFLMRAFMDEVRYNDAGNAVVLVEAAGGGQRGNVDWWDKRENSPDAKYTSPRKSRSVICEY